MFTFDVYLLNAFFKESSTLGKLNNKFAHQVLFFTQRSYQTHCITKMWSLQLQV